MHAFSETVHHFRMFNLFELKYEKYPICGKVFNPERLFLMESSWEPAEHALPPKNGIGKFL